jgi:hypothetical protein
MPKKYCSVIFGKKIIFSILISINLLFKNKSNKFILVLGSLNEVAGRELALWHKRQRYPDARAVGFSSQNQFSPRSSCSPLQHFLGVT